MVNYLDYNIKTARECRVRGTPAYCSPNDFRGSEDILYRNSGNGTFTNVAMQAGVAFTDSGKTVAGMGVDFRDLDNDGKPDIFQTAMFGDTFPLYHNLGSGQFEDATSQAGLTTLTSRLTAWGTGAYDFDNDGRKDLFIAASAIMSGSSGESASARS